MKLARLLSCLALMLVVGTGCASFSRHRLPEVGELAPPADAARAVSASYEFQWRTAVGSAGQLPEQFRQQVEKEFTDTLKESGYFMPLRSGKGESVHIDALVENYGNMGAAIAAGVVGGLSLTTIPVWATDGYRAKITVTAQEGAPKLYALDDAVTTVIWLPLIVATPFAGPGRVSEHARKNMYKTLIQKMQLDGILPPARPPAAPASPKP